MDATQLRREAVIWAFSLGSGDIIIELHYPSGLIKITIIVAKNENCVLQDVWWWQPPVQSKPLSPFYVPLLQQINCEMNSDQPTVFFFFFAVGGSDVQRWMFVSLAVIRLKSNYKESDAKPKHAKMKNESGERFAR